MSTAAELQLGLQLICKSAQLLTRSSAQLLTCSSAQLLTRSSAQLLTCSSAQLLTRSSAQLLTCSSVQLLTRSSAQLLTCRFAQLLTCSSVQLLTRSSAQLLTCRFAQVIQSPYRYPFNMFSSLNRDGFPSVKVKTPIHIQTDPKWSLWFRIRTTFPKQLGLALTSAHRIDPVWSPWFPPSVCPANSAHHKFSLFSTDEQTGEDWFKVYELHILYNVMSSQP
jgi:hypothetical protein